MLIVFQSNYTVPTNRHFHRTGFKLQLTPTRGKNPINLGTFSKAVDVLLGEKVPNPFACNWLKLF